MLECYGFGPRFISWIQLLYRDQTARVWGNGLLSAPFGLPRGTRQGCPLSPGLFFPGDRTSGNPDTSRPQGEGLTNRQIGVLKGKVSLYADVTLLYLVDVGVSLNSALEIITQFGGYFGIRINWYKSVLFTFHPSGSGTVTGTLLQWVEFILLGLQAYITNNISPLLAQLGRKCQLWKTLPLSPVGRVNLLKMVFPNFLYFFRSTPTPIPKSFFHKMFQLLFRRGKPRDWRGRCSSSPFLRGVWQCPHFQLYYWASVLVTVWWWFSQPKMNPAVTLEVAILGSYAALSNVSYRGPRAHSQATTLMRTTVHMWQQARAVYKTDSTISPHTPHSGNPTLPLLYKLPDPQLWASKGLGTEG